MIYKLLERPVKFKELLKKYNILAYLHPISDDIRMTFVTKSVTNQYF